MGFNQTTISTCPSARVKAALSVSITDSLTKLKKWFASQEAISSCLEGLLCAKISNSSRLAEVANLVERPVIQPGDAL
jgi:hypothetical protein